MIRSLLVKIQVYERTYDVFKELKKMKTLKHTKVSEKTDYFLNSLIYFLINITKNYLMWKFKIIKIYLAQKISEVSEKIK